MRDVVLQVGRHRLYDEELLPFARWGLELAFDVVRKDALSLLNVALAASSAFLFRSVEDEPDGSAPAFCGPEPQSGRCAATRHRFQPLHKPGLGHQQLALRHGGLQRLLLDRAAQRRHGDWPIGKEFPDGLLKRVVLL